MYLLVHKLLMLMPMFMCVNIISEDNAMCAYTYTCIASEEKAYNNKLITITLPIFRLINFFPKHGYPAVFTSSPNNSAYNFS